MLSFPVMLQQERFGWRRSTPAGAGHLGGRIAGVVSFQLASHSYPQQLTGIRRRGPCGLEPLRDSGIPASAPRLKREDFMGQINRLPSQFPDGTRFVIEGRAGRIVSRYLEFPDGRHVDLTTDHQGSGGRVRERRRLRKAARDAAK
ncbi:MAG TPA: hypothetical protein VG145_07825 [Xanthobacteraceae bacterium]|jgi:hypothetical protein|nr:hypothetical protein [Xanthobacteraceae bacterium]